MNKLTIQWLHTSNCFFLYYNFVLNWSWNIKAILYFFFYRVSPNIHRLILYYDLQTIPWRFSWENLIEDKSISRFVITSSIFATYSLDCALIHLPWLQRSVLKLGNWALESEIQLKRLESRIQSGIQVSLTEFGIQ